jgi:beta-phosphoglucomutase-like phosphatase (HAD superfamily)
MLTNSKLKAIFFDLDNVLVFSEMVHFEAWQIVMKSHGVVLNAIDYHNMIDINDFRQAKQLVATHSLPETIEELWERKRQTFLALIKNGFTCASGRNAFLEDCSQKYTLGVVSSSGKQVVNNILEHENLISFFQFVIGYEDCEFHKPHPLPYQMALNIAGISSNEALVIEDSVSGIMAAKQAHIPVLGLLKDQTPEQIVEDVHYFEDFNQIQNALTDRLFLSRSSLKIC